MADDKNQPADRQGVTPASWKRTAQRAKALFWQRLYRVQTRSIHLRLRHRKALYLGAALCLAAATLLLAGPLEAWLQSHFKTDNDLDGFRSLILNLGSALVGATAIVASLVLFALQVNIERMPPPRPIELITTDFDPERLGVYRSVDGQTGNDGRWQPVLLDR